MISRLADTCTYNSAETNSLSTDTRNNGHFRASFCDNVTTYDVSVLNSVYIQRLKLFF